MCPDQVTEAIENKVSRRDLLKWIGVGAFASFIGGSVLSTLRFIFPNVLYEPSSTFKAGAPDEYAPGTVSTKWVKTERTWIVRTNDGIYALWARCTHLGCTPGWFEAEKRFKCPCHGSNFDVNGDVIAGPAPRPLYRAAISLSEDGQIVVNKGRLEGTPGKRERKDFLLKA